MKSYPVKFANLNTTATYSTCSVGHNSCVLLPETKANYDLKFSGKEKDFVEFKDLPKLKEVTIAFWVKTNDQTMKGTIFSYSVPGKRNALSLADPNALRLYVNGDDKNGVHK